MQWTTMDPLCEKYYANSPYTYCSDDPAKNIDPDGKSGEAVIDQKNKIITITSNLILYGANANESTALTIAQNIQDQWNAAKGVATINNIKYSVTFVVNGSYNANLTKEDIKSNNNIKYNYYSIKTNGVSESASDGVSNNSGYFLYSQIASANSTTPSHEFGHGWGAVKGTADGHPKQKDIRGDGQPGMMYARGTIVDPAYQYNPSASPGTKGGTLDPDKRKVTQNDINYLELNTLQFDKNGKANVGKLTNIWH
jgi:hypothetical protein